MIINFLSAFHSFNSGDIVLLSVVLSVILRENQARKLYQNLTLLHYLFTTMPSNQQLTSPGSITAPRTPRDRLSGHPA